jgi:hypothetical protein
MMTVAPPSSWSKILRIPILLIPSSGHPASRTPRFHCQHMPGVMSW